MSRPHEVTPAEIIPPDAVGRGSIPDAATLKRIESLSRWLDSRFRLPGTNLRFGLDGVIGLVPGIGDTATTALGSYIILEAWRADMPKGTLARMGINLGLDWLVGTIPLIGDLLDFGFKANKRNADLLLKHLRERAATQPIRR